ncbi:hypothetical protein ACSBR2_011757 [Camellia fascicularis]
MSNVERPEVAMAVIGLIALFIAILLCHASPSVAPYIDYAGLLFLAIGFLAITTLCFSLSAG